MSKLKVNNSQATLTGALH